MKYSGWPDHGQLVVGKVDSIENFGVFIDLEEYEEKQGLVHVSEVASGWIKNIRDHVREDQTVVCKVIEVDESSQQIDLSIKDVNDHQRQEAIQHWKNEQKADNWMGIAFGDDQSTEDYSRVANELLDEFGNLYEAFEQAAIRGHEVLDETELTEEERDAIVTTARENVSVPFVSVTGYVDLQCGGPTGVDVIKDALHEAEGNGSVPEDVELSVRYVGSPEYRIRVKAPNYKIAERELEESAERATIYVEEHGGTGSFHREQQTEES